MTPGWAKWFTQLYLRAGGASAPTNNDILVSPMLNLGDMIYGITGGVPANLVGNTTTTKKFLTETGTGAAGAAPVFSTIVASDVPTLNQNTSGASASVSGTNVVTNANLTQMATKTVKGNNTGSTANAADMTVAQLNAILPVFTSLLNGLVPLSGGGTTNFLRADGAFAAPISASFSFYASSQVTTLASTASATFVTFSNSPALTFVPSVTGTYKVYCCFLIQITTAGEVAQGRIINTTGSATLLYESQIGVFNGVGGSGNSSTAMSIYTLTASTTYVFDIQGLTQSAVGTCYCRGDMAPFYMFAERVS